MTKAEKLTADQLIAQLAFQAETTKERATALLRALETVTLRALTEGKAITLPGIASLTPRTRPARKLRHPKSGEIMETPARRAVVARPLPRVTAALN